ncbi:hypothetical protein QTG54_008398 [Skeletonema marinoi]|uniref:Uncharacterized protein n=1 Tax=Skeletonema marinoi TaxID=267567 RepID=A0AAD9DB86_9STRA|nr:hypothetical protein QTG54_008398 [Skeletonema marinoi]
MTNVTFEEKSKVVFVGCGDKAHGFARMHDLHSNKHGKYQLVFTEPMPTKPIDPFDSDYVTIEHFPECLANADIVVIVIPSYAIDSFLIQNYTLLKEGSKGYLAALNITSDHWVKAFNDTGAIQEMQNSLNSKMKLTTSVCGPSDQCVKKIAALAKYLGYSPTVVPIDQYKCLQSCQTTLAGTFTYVTVQVSGRPHFQWYTLLARHSSKMFAWTAIWGFSLSLLPGTCIRLLKQVTYMDTTPRFLIWGCSIRKQVGLLSLYFVLLHACMMLLIFGGEYFGFLIDDGYMEWNTEASMLTAVLSTSLFTITGIASLPSVAHEMNKAQFMLVFGPVVWSALALGVMHVMFLGVPSWTDTPRSRYSWARGMPPVTLMASVLPLLVMFIKAVQVCHASMLRAKNWVTSRHQVSSIHASDHLFVIDDEVEEVFEKSRMYV